VVWVPVMDIVPSPYQPRRDYDDVAMAGLAESIRSSGVMQPLLVRRSPTIDGAYELIAGERRWRAAQDIDLPAVPVLVRDLSDLDAAQWALVENIQREDLNPMDRAFAFKQLADKFGLTHKEIAERVGIDRTAVTWHVKLTELEKEIADYVSTGKLSLGHAKVLVGIVPEARLGLARQCARGGWSVRELERTVKASAAAATAGPPNREQQKRMLVIQDLEVRLGKHFGTEVMINVGPRGGKSGTIALKFYDLDHFEGLMKKMGYAEGSRE
jgi:ParB family chromosome partitioning protein